MNSLALCTAIYVAGTFVSSFAQVLLKKSAGEKHSSLLAEYLNWRVIVAYLIFFGATLCSILAYRGIPLSMGPVLEASGYIFVTFFGWRFFGEKVGRRKLLALALIIGGICIYALGT